MQSAASIRSLSSSLPRRSYNVASRFRSSPVGVSMKGILSRFGRSVAGPTADEDLAPFAFFCECEAGSGPSLVPRLRLLPMLNSSMRRCATTDNSFLRSPSKKNVACDEFCHLRPPLKFGPAMDPSYLPCSDTSALLQVVRTTQFCKAGCCLGQKSTRYEWLFIMVHGEGYLSRRSYGPRS